MMRAPAFWQNPPDAPGLAATLLAPAARIYGAATARRVARPPDLIPGLPVICVGNLTAGGSGKTPTVMALIQKLDGKVVHVVTRGYGGRMVGPQRVDERRHGAGDVGDEPLLLAAFAPTWVARDRAEGVRAAIADGAEAVILDDGFQNPSVAKSLSLVVADARLGFGNGRVLPAGPLREPIAAGLARADLLVTIGDAAAQERFTRTWPTGDMKRATGHLAPLPTGMAWKGQRVLAFAGIGYPEKFFATLRAQGVELVRAEALDDHQPLTETLMKRLEIEAEAMSAHLVTTEKDAVRLPASFRQKVLTLPVRLDFDDSRALDAALSRLFPT